MKTPMMPLCTHYDLTDETDTARLAGTLATLARPGDVIALNGALGAGKSVLARAFVRALCGAKTEVPSPTYTLVQSYDAPDFTIIHADLYRLQGPEEVEETGLCEHFDTAVTLIEWPQKLGPLMPPEHLQIDLQIKESGARAARLCGFGRRWEARTGKAA